MKKIHSSHVFLFVTSVMLILIGFFQPDKTVDIHIHDTYFVISNPHYYFGMGLLLLLITVIVFLTKSVAWKSSLMWLHTVATAVIFLFLALIPIIFSAGLAGEPRRYYDLSGSPLLWNRHENLSNCLQLGLLLLLIAQLLFVINICIGLIKKLLKN